MPMKRRRSATGGLMRATGTALQRMQNCLTIRGHLSLQQPDQTKATTREATPLPAVMTLRH
eukprot:2341767-Heterocapsa_arctica.AAC.1